MQLTLISLLIINFDFTAEGPYFFGFGIKQEIEYFLMEFILIDSTEGDNFLKVL
jgi:hypothetical protein